MHIKLFLLSSIEYTTDNAGDSAYVASLLGMAGRRDRPFSDGDRLLDGGQACYSESTDTADAFQLDAVEAVNRARGMTMIVAGQFRVAPISQPRPSVAGASIANVASHLLYDTHACFLLVTEVAIEVPASTDASQLVEALFSGHALFANLGIGDYMQEAFAAATQRALHLLGTLTPGLGISACALHFSEGSTLPVLVSGAPLAITAATFRSEGSTAFAPDSPLVRDCPGGVFHPGWNYVIAAGMSQEALAAILQLTLRAQTFYFSLGYMKTYFAEETRRTLAAGDAVSQADVERAEQVRLAFHDMLGEYSRYRNQLVPKYFDALNALTQRWHCMDDVADIKEYIALNLEAKDRRHARQIMKLNQRQSNALALIAVLQLISIYGSLDTGRSLFGNAHWLFYAGTIGWIAILLVFLVMSRYTKAAIACAVLAALSALAWLVSGWH